MTKNEMILEIQKILRKYIASTDKIDLIQQMIIEEKIEEIFDENKET
jgi:hypothetical protein